MSREAMSWGELALAYLSPDPWMFWQWDDRGEATEVVGGDTIAFRQELSTILGALDPERCPSLSTILLLIGHWRGDLVLDEEWVRLPEVPHDLVGTIENRGRVLRLLFENAPPSRPELTAAVLDRLLAPLPSDSLSRQPSSDLETFRSELRHLERVWSDFDWSRFTSRFRTGFDQVPEAAPEVRELELSQSPAEQVRQLLEEVQADSELGGVARAAQRLLGFVAIPQGVSEPDELAVGGVSDIVPRGPLDRLLVSELAYDATTLSMRIALGEALYLRREAPPAPPPRHRQVLIDNSLRSWGTPRYLALSVALALAATSRSPDPCLMFRAEAGGCVPIDGLRAEGLRVHLEALSGEKNSVSSFEAFLRQAQFETESIFVCEEGMLRDPSWKLAVARWADTPFFVCTVSRTGKCQLLRYRGGGRKLMNEAQLDLQALIKNTAVVAVHDRGLPKLAVSKDLPLRLPVGMGWRRTAVDPQHGVLCVTRDGRLMHWDDPRHGARQVTNNLPGHEMESVKWGPDHSAWLLYRSAAHLLQRVDLDSGRTRSLELALPGKCKHMEVASPREVLFFGRDWLAGIDPQSGVQTLRCHEIKGTWLGGRFFRGADGQVACPRSFRTWLDASQPRMTEVPFPGRDPEWTNKIRRVFDRVGVGPYAIDEAGECSSLTGDHRFATGLSEPLVIGVSSDGSYLLVSSPVLGGPAPALVDLHAGKLVTTAAQPLQRLESKVDELMRAAPTLFLKGVSVGPDLSVSNARGSTLVWRSKRGRGHATQYLRGDETSERVREAMDQQVLARELSIPEVRHRLAAVTWSDGSRAVLDSRGLLHLQSSRPSLPEITLVLKTGIASGYCPAIGAFGEAYFADPFAQVDTAEQRVAQDAWGLVEQFRSRLPS